MTAADRTHTAIPRDFDIGRLPWWALCLVLAVVLAASCLALGFRLPYWRNADQDLVLAYHGLLLNDGRPQEYFDHPGYLYFLIIAGWYRLLHTLGLLEVARLSDLPPLADAVAYDAAWQQLVQAGRGLSILLCAGFVVTVATLVRFILEDRLIGFLSGLAVAFAMGVMTQARQMRTDLLSGILAALALLLAILAVRRRPGVGPLGLMALAGGGASLAMASKVQAIFPLLATPAITVAFGRSWREPVPGGWGRALLLALLAAAALVPAVEILRFGIDGWGRAIYPYRPVGAGLSGHYQGILAGWVVLGILAHAAVWRLRPVWAVQALAAVALGVAVGLLSLLIRWHEQNAIAVANFIEHMFVFTTWRHPGELQAEGQVLSGSLAGLLLEGLWRTFAIRTVVLHPDRIPQTLLVEWFAIAGAVVAWRRGDRLLPLRVALLLGAAWGLETLFSLRGFQRAYAIYTDPLAVLAAALVLVRFRGILEGVRSRRWLYGGMALYVALAHVWPVVFELRRGDPRPHCEWIPIYMKNVEGFPFCQR